jgi:hypothetical protein
MARERRTARGSTKIGDGENREKRCSTQRFGPSSRDAVPEVKQYPQVQYPQVQYPQVQYPQVQYPQVQYPK